MSNKVTKKQIESRIVTTEYIFLPNSTVTICHITLDSGYSVRGESACVDPADFEENIGKQLAYDDAFRKLWPLFGFLKCEELYQSRSGAAA